MTELALGPPLWKLWSTKSYRRFDQAAETVSELSNKMVERAKNDSGRGSDEKTSILQKLIKRCGPDSPIPHLMCQDALTAGVDTTGTTAAFLLLDLARNKEKQEIKLTNKHAENSRKKKGRLKNKQQHLELIYFHQFQTLPNCMTI